MNKDQHLIWEAYLTESKDDMITPGLLPKLEDTLYDLTKGTRFNITEFLYPSEKIRKHPLYGDVYRLDDLMSRLSSFIPTHFPYFQAKGVDPSDLRGILDIALSDIKPIEDEIEKGKKYYTWEDSLDDEPVKKWTPRPKDPYLGQGRY